MGLGKTVQSIALVSAVLQKTGELCARTRARFRRVGYLGQARGDFSVAVRCFFFPWRGECSREAEALRCWLRWLASDCYLLLGMVLVLALLLRRGSQGLYGRRRRGGEVFTFFVTFGEGNNTYARTLASTRHAKLNLVPSPSQALRLWCSSTHSCSRPCSRPKCSVHTGRNVPGIKHFRRRKIPFRTWRVTLPCASPKPRTSAPMCV